jgi:hypothetical protein
LRDRSSSTFYVEKDRQFGDGVKRSLERNRERERGADS